MRDPLKSSGLKYSSLIVGWTSDAGKLGEKVVDYLLEKLGGQSFQEIEPAEFFPLNGVSIEDDLVQFPESELYECPDQHLLILKSTPPCYDWYRFFGMVLDIANRRAPVGEVYALGGMLSLIAHAAPRRLLGTFSSLEMKEDLSHYDLDSGPNYETPPGQKPTLNSFFLWSARKRDFPGVSLWIPVPFYLMSLDDPKAQKRMLQFLDRRFGLGMDLNEFDAAIRKQDRQLDEARNRDPDVDDYIMRLENNLRLSEDENVKLVRQVEEYLKQTQEG